MKAEFQNNRLFLMVVMGEKHLWMSLLSQNQLAFCWKP
jgi:hypothetical protein